VSPASPLVLAAHGSTDPRFGEVVASIAALVADARSGLEVRIGYLDHGVSLESVTDASCVVVPVLLTSGFHVRSDIPGRAAGVIARPIGPDRRLVTVLAQRLREAGWDRQLPLVLAAAGSSDPKALADVHQTARDLGDELGLDVPAAFVSDGSPSLSEVYAVAAASYLLAPGRFADAVAASAAAIVAAPLGAHPLIAEIILDRYDAADQSLADVADISEFRSRNG
jgi:sirohydrochlorin ferrochelatase